MVGHCEIRQFEELPGDHSGYVWFRGSRELVAQVDPSGRVVRRIGTGEGSGSASAGSGQLWISAHDVATLYRVPVG
jgi:streptogramin lyase